MYMAYKESSASETSLSRDEPISGVLYNSISLKENNLKQTCVYRSTGRETSFSTERCKTVVQSVVPQIHIHDMGPSIVFMKP